MGKQNPKKHFFQVRFDLIHQSPRQCRFLLAEGVDIPLHSLQQLLHFLRDQSP